MKVPREREEGPWVVDLLVGLGLERERKRETRVKWASIWPELYFYITTCSFVKSLIHYAVKKIFFFFLINSEKELRTETKTKYIAHNITLLEQLTIRHCICDNSGENGEMFTTS